MNRATRLCLSIIFGLAGVWMIWSFGNWQIALGVFLMEFAHNIEWHDKRPE